jgi:hypothetical protein
MAGAGERHSVPETFEEPSVGLDDVGPGGGRIRDVELRSGDERKQLRST